MSGWLVFFQYMDAWLMPIYRLPETPIIGFFLGTAALALVSVVIGDITFNIAVRADRKKIRETTGETVRMNNLSIEALQAGDGDSYRACNKLANESFGKMFFLQLALSTASLWPIPFALSWMQYRFMDIEFPLLLIPLTFSYAGVFLPMYVLLRIAFGKVRPRIPFLRGAADVFKGLSLEAGRMRSWRDLFPSPPTKNKSEA